MHRALDDNELLKSILSFLPSRDLATSVPLVSQHWLAASGVVQEQRAAIVLHAVLVLHEYRSLPLNDNGVLLKDVTLNAAVSQAAGMCAEAAGLMGTGDAKWEETVATAKAEAEAIGPPTLHLTNTFNLVPVTLRHRDLHLVDDIATRHLFSQADPATPVVIKGRINDNALQALVVLHAAPVADTTLPPPYHLTIRCTFPEMRQAAYKGNPREGFFGEDFVALFRVDSAELAKDGPPRPTAQGLWLEGLHICDEWLAGKSRRGTSAVYSRNKWLELVRRGKERGVDFAIPRIECWAPYYLRKHVFLEDLKFTYLELALEEREKASIGKLEAFVAKNLQNVVKQIDIMGKMSLKDSAMEAAVARIFARAFAELQQIQLGEEYFARYARATGYKGDLEDHHSVFAHLVARIRELPPSKYASDWSQIKDDLRVDIIGALAVELGGGIRVPMERVRRG
ncbi:hypothetical protein HDU96_008166 [Phlyctochytrium bullatum]|nr:hypothetical protein HDU96_008166 [Phlyctochytrium bullatum]